MIPLFKPLISGSVKDAVSDVLSSGMIGEGPRVGDFTNILKKELDHEHVTCLNGCTSALRVAYRLAGIRGGRVIVPSFTFPATNTAALEESPGSLIFHPVDKRTLTIDVCNKDFTSLFDEQIDAVVITLVGGIPPYNLRGLKEFLEDHGTKLIIDAAHATFSTYEGKHVCHYADYTTLSFQSIKHWTTGDGGALICSSKEDHDLVQKLKWFGISRNIPPGVSRLEHQMTYSIKDAGFKYHMNDISAAIGTANQEVAKDAARLSKSNAALYQSLLRSTPNITLLSPPPKSDPAWWVYGFLCNEPGVNLKLISYLETCGIQASPLWRSNHLHDCFSHTRQPWDVELEDYTCFVPNGAWVSVDDIGYIADKINVFMTTGEQNG